MITGIGTLRREQILFLLGVGEASIIPRDRSRGGMSPFIHLSTMQAILWEGGSAQYLPDLEPDIGCLMGSEPSILRSEAEFSKMGIGRSVGLFHKPDEWCYKSYGIYVLYISRRVPTHGCTLQYCTLQYIANLWAAHIATSVLH